MEASRAKLEKVYEQLKPHISQDKLHISPCTSDDETVGYRCKCSFQLVRDDQDRLQYAIRQQGRPIVIQEFHVANDRIRRAMIDFLLSLHNDTTNRAFIDDLSSVSFASSWSSDGDCIITCNYDEAIHEPELWEQQARAICQENGLAQLVGRFRKGVLSAFPHEGVLRDKLAIRKTNNELWLASVVESEALDPNSIIVEYEKPEAAFYHPNSRAMLKALKWQLEQISAIAKGLDHCKPRLLELYCGCGAHTVALAKSGMLESIVAVELDQRLVNKCARNIQLNQLENVSVVTDDAGLWARKKGHASFDVMLVDPPRQGLAEDVCRLAIESTDCQHLLYISCGYEALIRDVQLLSAGFDVLDCTVIDLFPTMEGVESLVHLRRQK